MSASARLAEATISWLGTSPQDGCSTRIRLELGLPHRIPPTRADIEIANAVAKYTRPETEHAAKVLTWGADEHVLLAIAGGWWLYCRGRPPQERRNSDHILLT